MINTTIYSKASISIIRYTSNKRETNDMHPNGSRDQFNFANELMCVKRGLRMRGVIEEVKEECYDGGEREGNYIKGITTVFDVV